MGNEFFAFPVLFNTLEIRSVSTSRFIFGSYVKRFLWDKASKMTCNKTFLKLLDYLISICQVHLTLRIDRLSDYSLYSFTSGSMIENHASYL